MKAGRISLKTINPIKYRFDASYHLSEGVTCKEQIKHSPYPSITIGEAAKRIFHAGRWKRTYVSNRQKGIPLLGSADILQSDLSIVKLISRKFTPDISDKILEKGWILISCSGTIGNSVFTTKRHAEKLASQDVIRLVPNDILRAGYIYAYLSTSYGYNLLTQGTFGAVIQHIEPQNVENIPIPVLPDSLQNEIDNLIQSASILREEAADMLDDAQLKLKDNAELKELTPNDYDYFGPHSADRKVSCFKRNIKDIGTTTINAFNHSERIRKLKASMTCKTIPLKDALKDGQTFGSSGAPSIEVKPGHGVMLINQKDIFDNIIKGKWISSRGVNLDNLVDYGEILIACDGTLGESELFCRAIFANEDLKGSFISSHFLWMKTIDDIPSGYLYTWLSSDYGFRFIRNTQAGTKLCHPINKLFLDIPVPVIDKGTMNEIDRLVREAHTKRHQANQKELEAISMVEDEIEKWNS